MAKKRGKSGQKAISGKQPKKAKAPSPGNKPEITSEERKPLKEALHELEILAEEKKIERKVENVEKKEEKIEQKEESLAKEEKKIEREAGKVEGLEKKISQEVRPQALTKFNIRDLNKGIIGAFIGVVAHFGFLYGKAIASAITVPRATLLLAFSYMLLVILMYETGYRAITENRLLGILPKRATIIFITSLIVVVVIYLLFGLVDLKSPDYVELYKGIAVTSVLASLGAGTADLLGRH